jgi:hypothetical protein
VWFALVQDGEACLIDFDFAGQPLGPRLYPAGFVDDIRRDGIRHPDAKAGKRLKYEHDCFSAIQLLVLSADSVPMGNCRTAFKAVVNDYASLDSPTDQTLIELVERLSRLGFVDSPLDQSAFPPVGPATDLPVKNRHGAVPK